MKTHIKADISPIETPLKKSTLSTNQSINQSIKNIHAVRRETASNYNYVHEKGLHTTSNLIVLVFDKYSESMYSSYNRGYKAVQLHLVARATLYAKWRTTVFLLLSFETYVYYCLAVVIHFIKTIFLIL